MKRTREQVIWDFVQGWLDKGGGDLRAAEHLVEVQEKDYFVAAFHAQQAAEKYLKALLVRHQIPFPKTHDIRQLLGLAAQAHPARVQCWCSSKPYEGWKHATHNSHDCLTDGGLYPSRWMYHE